MISNKGQLEEAEFNLTNFRLNLSELESEPSSRILEIYKQAFASSIEELESEINAYNKKKN